ncbi:MAG: hypothetical protein IIW96_07150 [Oscillibacter sp.]|nr:hypothetical protein [Oscillibacter sp.]
MRKILGSRRGETLVEALCACFLLVLVLGALLGAVRLAGNIRSRSELAEKKVAQLRKSLEEADTATAVAITDYMFTKYFPDGPRHGEAPLFTVTASLETKDAVYQAEDGEWTTVTFRLFACPEEGGAP